MINSVKRCVGLFCLIGLIFISLTAAMAQKSDDNKPSASMLPPSGLKTVVAGPLEIIPSKANLLLVKQGNQTHLDPTIRFKISNTSASDVKIIIFRNSVGASDNLGESLFDGWHNIKSAGILLSDKNPDRFSEAFQDQKGQFITLAPKQLFEAQLTPSQARSIDDKDGEFFKNHRPETLTFSATLGIINFDGTTELRAFSFSDLPVLVTTR